MVHSASLTYLCTQFKHTLQMFAYPCGPSHTLINETNKHGQLQISESLVPLSTHIKTIAARISSSTPQVSCWFL